MIKRMKKVCVLGCLIVALCVMAGCGNSGTKERLKTGGERALELREDAQDAVDQVNQDTINLEKNANDIDQE